MSERSAQTGRNDDEPPKPTRAQRLAAFGFLGAFGLTIITVLLTGLSVGAPNARHVLQPAPPDRAPAQAAKHEPSSNAQATPPAAPQGAAEARTSEDAVRPDPARDRDDETRKDARQDADDSRAHDAR